MVDIDSLAAAPELVPRQTEEVKCGTQMSADIYRRRGRVRKHWSQPSRMDLIHPDQNKIVTETPSGHSDAVLEADTRLCR